MLPGEFRNDREILLIAVRRNGESLYYAWRLYLLQCCEKRQRDCIGWCEPKRIFIKIWYTPDCDLFWHYIIAVCSTKLSRDGSMLYQHVVARVNEFVVFQTVRQRSVDGAIICEQAQGSSSGRWTQLSEMFIFWIAVQRWTSWPRTGFYIYLVYVVSIFCCCWLYSLSLYLGYIGLIFCLGCLLPCAWYHLVGVCVFFCDLKN